MNVKPFESLFLLNLSHCKKKNVTNYSVGLALDMCVCHYFHWCTHSHDLENFCFFNLVKSSSKDEHNVVY